MTYPFRLTDSGTFFFGATEDIRVNITPVCVTKSPPPQQNKQEGTNVLLQRKKKKEKSSTLRTQNFALKIGKYFRRQCLLCGRRDDCITGKVCLRGNIFS